MKDRQGPHASLTRRLVLAGTWAESALDRRLGMGGKANRTYNRLGTANDSTRGVRRRPIKQTLPRTKAAVLRQARLDHQGIGGIGEAKADLVGAAPVRA